MKIKFKKDIFLKKSTWLVLGIFAITLVNIPRFKIQASSEKDDLSFTPDTVKILEVGSGNGYLLTNNSKVPEVEAMTAENNQKVEVTHMDMAKYISMVDDIEGKYDVVAITNKKTNNMSSNYDVNKVYRNYTKPFDQSMGYAKYLGSEWKVAGYALRDGYNEYYPENDITNKRGQLIVDMINNGQLVYVDSSATEVAGTKLNQIFNGQGIGSGITSKSNFKKVSSNEITLQKVIDEYNGLSIGNKRVKISGVTGPKSEAYNSDGTVTNERMLNFSVKANAEQDETLTANVYLDFDGDGLYTGKPYRSFPLKGINGYQTYDFQVPINNGFIGYLGWKVDIVRSNGNVKTSVVSHSIYHAQNGKKNIRVLQIYPNETTWSYYDNRSNKDGTGNTRLKDSKDFMNLLAGLQDYNIDLKDISADDFNSQYGASSSKKHLIDSYDMVIVGFADYYAGADINSTDALADLDNFIAAGKSVMFTHDTIGLGIVGASKGPKMFAQHYKDIVGQSWYTDAFRTDNKNLYTKVSDDGQVAQTTIPHDKAQGGKTLGQTALAIDGNQSEQQTGTRLWETTQTNKVKNVNNAQITTYPFDLRDYNNGDGTLEVSLTHTQWYQLNLEDPDVVPWYNLVGGTMDSGDSRNFYYTYNKGNITYSGTGHSGVATGKQELELFVNTIIKAERGSNAAPTVENFTDANTKNSIKDGTTVEPKIDTEKDYTFYVLPEDTDNDKLNISVKVLGQEIFTKRDYTGHEPIEVTINSNVYKDVVKGGEIPVEVTATDPLGEKGTSSFTLICDGNRPPVINNTLTSGNAINDKENIGYSRTADFSFVSVPTDPDEEDFEDLKVSITVDGKDIAKVTDSDNEEITSDTSVCSGQKLNVVIPKSAFEGKNTNDTVNVVTTVTDPKGKTDTKSFVITINPEKPTALLQVVDKVNEDGSFEAVANNKKFKNLEVATIAGKVNSVFDPNGTITITVPKQEIVQGDVTVSRLVNGELSESKEMVKGDTDSVTGETTYTFDLSSNEGKALTSLAAREDIGMSFVVQFNAKIDDTKLVDDAKKNADSKSSDPVTKETYNENGDKIITTSWIVTKTWECSNIYTNYLTFGDAKSSAAVYMHMSDSEEKPDETSIIIPRPENYFYVDLF